MIGDLGCKLKVTHVFFFFPVLCRQYKVFLIASTLQNAITFAFLKHSFISTYGFTVKLHYP
jgi:hypothetical protein